jgi:hypothetical protein
VPLGSGATARGELLSLEALLCLTWHWTGRPGTRKAGELEARLLSVGYLERTPSALVAGVDRHRCSGRQSSCAGWCWCKYDLKPYADQARALAPQIKVALHFTIKDSMSDTQVIHQLLSQLGIKLTLHWSRSVPGYVGEKLRTYVLDQEHWSQIVAVLERREAKRQRLQERGTEGGRVWITR